MKLNLRKIFNWDIRHVAPPMPVYDIDYCNPCLGRTIIGYDVTVQYEYHGQDTYFFDMDSERLWALYGHPRRAAENFYQQKCREMARQQQKRCARQK